MLKKLGRPITLPEPLPRSCRGCGEMFTPIRKKWKRIYCSHTCQWNAVKKPVQDHPELQEAARQKQADSLRGRGTGYIKRNGRHEHRTIAEKMLGRLLNPNEIVHHINGDKQDNRPENLSIITQSQHINLHRDDLEKGKEVARR